MHWCQQLCVCVVGWGVVCVCGLQQPTNYPREKLRERNRSKLAGLPESPDELAAHVHAHAM